LTAPGNFLPSDYQSLTQSMLLRRERHELLMPELELFLFRERTHVSNDRRFLFHDVVDLANKAMSSDVFRQISGCSGCGKRRILIASFLISLLAVL